MTDKEFVLEWFKHPKVFLLHGPESRSVFIYERSFSIIVHNDFDPWDQGRWYTWQEARQRINQLILKKLEN